MGRALKKVIPSVVKREDLFITSKLWNSSHRPENVETELDETLKQLGIDYLDLYCEYREINEYCETAYHCAQWSIGPLLGPLVNCLPSLLISQAR